MGRALSIALSFTHHERHENYVLQTTQFDASRSKYYLGKIRRLTRPRLICQRPWIAVIFHKPLKSGVIDQRDRHHWILIMEKNLPALPNGPVVCENRSDSHHDVKMQKYPQKTSVEAMSEFTADTELQTYRCPECESISVFSVT